MSSLSSIIQVLIVEQTDSKTIDQATGQPFKRTAARCILLDEHGQPTTVGRLRVPKSLVDQVKVGTFTASFALVVPDYGDDKGDVVAQLTSLIPMPSRSAPSAATQGAKS